MTKKKQNQLLKKVFGGLASISLALGVSYVAMLTYEKTSHATPTEQKAEVKAEQKAEQKAVCRQWQNHSNLIFRLN